MRSAPSSTTRSTWAALGLGLLLLNGCGAGEGEFAPECPTASLVPSGADLHRFRSNGRDITDSVLEGRITDVSGACRRTGDNTVTATVAITLELTRGPAAPGRTADVGYFVAVTQGERIIDKQVFRLRAEFPSNTDRLRLTGDEVELKLPVTPQKTAASFQVRVGFELTPAELQLNRQQSDRRTR